MSRYLYAVFAFVAAALIIWAISNHEAAARGAAGEQLKQGEAQVKQGEKALAKADTIYQRDTVVLYRQVKSYTTLHDTLNIHDTVQVKVFVTRADSTIRACLLTVLTCEQKDSAHKVIEAGLNKEKAALQKLVPGKTEKIVTALKWAGSGFVLGVAYGLHRK